MRYANEATCVLPQGSTTQHMVITTGVPHAGCHRTVPHARYHRRVLHARYHRTVPHACYHRRTPGAYHTWQYAYRSDKLPHRSGRHYNTGLVDITTHRSDRHYHTNLIGYRTDLVDSLYIPQRSGRHYQQIQYTLPQRYDRH